MPGRGEQDESAPRIGKSRSEAVARRIREQLAGRRISASTVARQIGMTQTAISRRLVGRTDMTIDEIEAICRAAGISFEYAVLGRGEPDGPESVRHQGLEPRTR
ncbi:helix-turn-helix transcriptional regulator [Skermania piniformis]|uniref:Helix-turn-helix transcriptional regulator n=3 Tax=Skermania pinensis TaxID=39122 RepID=A0ABX8SD44_9ACTN|nr:helix-turn-helix transcriptional regulator [Skermania piniformis]